MVARRPRVLVIEERDEAAAAITSALSGCGCVATVVGTIDGAIRMAREVAPVLALVHVGSNAIKGAHAAMALGDEAPSIRIVAYGSRLDRRLARIAARLGLTCPVLDEERIAEWIAAAVPKIARLALLERSVRIRTRKFSLRAGGSAAAHAFVPSDLNGAVRDLEDAAIRAALKRASGCQREAARLLSISESSLRTKMDKYEIAG
ncbi:MAG: hypothetical protein HYY06_04335 [Deltaproteobacteria bacterium]|nr:hypothetical protein [Deltaproteobacteria bacterium]